MDNTKSVFHTALAGGLLAAGIVFSSAAPAGTIILEGSDAIGFHSNSNPFATAYRDQVWSAIGGSDPRPIAVLGAQPVSAGFVGTGTHAISSFATLAAAGTLSNYVALYFLAGGGCCAQDDSLVDEAAEKAAVAAYLSGGGTVMIENYIGGAEWDFVIPTGGAGNAHVAGFAGGLPGPGCSDGELITAEGLLNGFTQPGPMGCWTHQGYEESFFAPLGFTKTFFDAGPGFPGLPGDFSSLLSSGLTVVGVDNSPSVPEPGTLAVLALGLAGLGWSRRKAS